MSFDETLAYRLAIKLKAVLKEEFGERLEGDDLPNLFTALSMFMALLIVEAEADEKEVASVVKYVVMHEAKTIRIKKQTQGETK